MNTRRFQSPLTTVAELEALIGTPSELVLKKQLAELDGFMATFIAESPFLLLGTFDREGRCDVSPRGDGFGLAKVLDPKTIVIPDRRGNRRADSLRNILETGRVGLLFLIPGRGETLRVNGGACLIRDEDVLAPLAADGKAPLVGIAVDIEECYFQCAKAILRSRLWNPRDAGQPSSLPCLAEILVEQTKIEGQTVESLNRLIEDSYANNLY
jgi:PPOX class probable FMN-dependent enzyme